MGLGRGTNSDNGKSAQGLLQCEDHHRMKAMVAVVCEVRMWVHHVE